MHNVAFQAIRPKWRRMCLAVAVGFCTVGSNIALMATAGYLISKAAAHPQTILLLWVPIVAVRFFGLLRAVSRYLERMVSHDVTFRILTDLRLSIYNVLEPRWPAAISKWTMGRLMDTMTNDIEALQNVFLKGLFPPSVAIVAAGLSYTLIACLGDFALADVLLIGLVFVGIVFPALGYRTTHYLHKLSVDERSMLSQQIADLVAGMPDLMMTDDGGQSFLSTLHARQLRLNHIQVKLAVRQGMFAGLSVVVTAGTAWLMVILALPRLHHGQLNALSLCVIVLISLASFEAVQPLASAFTALGESVASFRRLQELEDWPTSTPAPIPNPSQQTPSFRPSSPCGVAQRNYDLHQHTALSLTAWHIHVEHASFAYTTVEQKVITDITFDASPGQHLAIVGHNGAGKSTIIQLLTRLWDVQQGAIKIDGIDVRHLPVETIRKGIAVVSSHAHVFHASIADNLRIAKPTATMQELIFASEAAQLRAWIEQLPNGFDTIVGETAHGLSGGQRQRIAVARAVLANPRVFLLDEPLEYLDHQTASRIQEILTDITRDRTTIRITHHLQTVTSVDEILVLEDGRIIERGRHDDLLREMGRYRQMWDIEQNMI